MTTNATVYVGRMSDEIQSTIHQTAQSKAQTPQHTAGHADPFGLRSVEGDDAKQLPGAQPPDETGLTTYLGHVHRNAAGMEAIIQSAKLTLQQMGPGRGVKAWLKVNKKDGFDCQSCAWPNPDDHRHVFEFCENGVKALADEGTTKRITEAFFAQHSIRDLQEKSDHWLGQQGRLTTPMVKHKNGTHYEAISWDDAFALMGRELNALANPDEAAFYTSGRTSNEAAFLYQLFVRQFGTNNLPDCSNMCHESSGAALNEAIGIGKGCVTLADFEKCDAIFIVGQNPGTNHPRMMSVLERAKRHGAKIVAINPLPESGLLHVVNPNPQEYPNLLKFPGKLLFNRGTKLADIWLPVRINGDMALFKGILKEMLTAEEARPGSVFDQEFIQEHTVGFEELIADIRAADWDEITTNSGLTREQICEAANVAIHAKRIITCWAMGLTQHKNAVGTIQMVMNMLLLGGNIGRAGAGPCPVRGHSNVQGDRTMGICARMNTVFLDRLGAEFGFEPPRKRGLDTVETIRRMHDGRIRFFLGLGGNFLSATPDTEFTAQSLQKCRLTAHISIKLNRSHLIAGEIALILPCLGRSEIDRGQFVTVEDSMGIISSSRGLFEPASDQLRSECQIIAGLARATLGQETTVPWEDLVNNYGLIRDRIERVIPGFEKFNERIVKDIFYLPNDARDRWKFNNDLGKAKFTVHPIPDHALASGQFVMMTIRSHDQFNTHIYGLNDRYRGVYNGRRVVFLNAEDIAEAGLQAGQLVDLTSHFSGRERVAKHFLVTPFEIPRRCAATYFPEANVLVPIESVAQKSNTPTSKFVIISIRPSPDAESAARKLHIESLEASQLAKPGLQPG